MSHDPKLEIFKIRLIRKEDGGQAIFRDFFRTKFKQYIGWPKPITPSDIFKAHHAEFIKFTEKKDYNIKNAKSKGFTIAYDDVSGKRTSHICSPHNDDMILSGILEGGKHGIKRWLGDVSDTSKKSDIGVKNIVNDRFYFLLYTPLDHSQGILMIQGYTESKISDVFRDHLSKYFKIDKQMECRFEIFIPASFQREYLDQATFKKVRFTSGWNAKLDFNGTEEKEYELEVKIEIVDKSTKKLNYQSFGEIIAELGKSVFKLEGGRQRNLGDFEKKDAKMESKGKEFPIQFDDEDNIKPVILLKNQGIEVLEGQIPNFEQINVFSRNMLNDIKKEIFPSHGISEL